VFLRVLISVACVCVIGYVGFSFWEKAQDAVAVSNARAAAEVQTASANHCTELLSKINSDDYLKMAAPEREAIYKSYRVDCMGRAN